MSRKARKLLLCLAVVFFIAIAPSLLLYACGYSFDWRNKKIVMTGGFYFKSSPKQAEIYLDDELKGETPTLIKRILPGEYYVSIQKAGYHPWQKNLRIKSQLVTEARNILLIPQWPATELIESDLPDNFSVEKYLSLKNHFSDNFYLSKPDNILYYQNPNNLEQKQISRVPLPDGQEYRIFAFSESKIALLSAKKELYLFDPEQNDFQKIAEGVENLQFTGNGQKFLYYAANEIWAYYLEDILVQPNKLKDEKELITRTSQKIKTAVWYPGTNEHIFFTVNGKTKTIELDDRDQRNAIDLFDYEISQITYYPEEEKTYFIKDNKLFKMALEEK